MNTSTIEYRCLNLHIKNDVNWSVNDWIDFIDKNPYLDKQVLDTFLETGKQSLILEFINEYFLKHEKFPDFFDLNPFEALKWLPNDLRWDWISKFPETFIVFLEKINETQQNELFQFPLNNNWKCILTDGFEKVVKDISVNPVSISHPSYLFVQFILNILSINDQKVIFKYFIQNLNNWNYLFFLQLLTNVSDNIEEFCSLIFETYSECGFKDICRCIVEDVIEISEFPVKKYQSQKLVKILLNECISNSDFNKSLVEKFNEMHNIQQIYFIELLSDEIVLNELFNNFKESYIKLVDWCELYFKSNDNFDERVNFLKKISVNIKVDTLAPFIKEILASKTPFASIYLFFCLKGDPFDELVSEISSDLQTKIFNSVIIDRSLNDFLIAWYQHPSIEHLRYVVALNLSWQEKNDDFQFFEDGEENVDIIEKQFTIQTCFNQIFELSLNPEVIQVYLPFVHEIPPVLLSLYIYPEGFRDCILSLICAFTDNQLEFLMVPFWNDLGRMVPEFVKYKIRQDQLCKIFFTVPKEKFDEFVNQKIELFQSSLAIFNEKYRELEKEIKTIKSENNEFIPEQQIEILENKLFELRTICMRSEQFECQAIIKYLEENDFYNHQVYEFKKIQHELRQKKEKINEASEIRKEIDFIENCVNYENNPKSIVELLPEWFWSLFRDNDLKYFKAIDHFEELQKVGIYSEKDLLILGVLIERISVLENLIQKIFELNIYNEDQKIVILNLWNQFFRIEHDKNEVEKIFNELFDVMTQSINAAGIKKILSFLYNEISSFKFIKVNEIESMELRVRNVQAKLWKRAIMLGKETLKDMLHYIRLAHPKVTLQKYLKNKKLIQIWKNLNQQGFCSIHDYVEKKELTVSDLFALN